MGFWLEVFSASVPCEPPVFWLAYRHTGGGCGHVHGVDVWIYSAHVCFSEWLGILGVPVVNLCVSLRALGPQIYPSIRPSQLTGLHLWRIPGCVVLSTHH